MSGWVAGAIVVGAVIGSEASKDSADTVAEANNEAVREQQRAREQFLETTQPFVDIGLDAGSQLQNLLNDPTAGLEEINPVVDILRNQGFEQIQESAAAQGRLGAGGTLKDLTQFNTDLATTVIPQLQEQRFNQLFNVLGLGANAATGQGTASLSTASNISNILGNTGVAQANQSINQANVATNALGQFSQLFGSQQTPQTTTPAPVSTATPSTRGVDF